MQKNINKINSQLKKIKDITSQKHNITNSSLLEIFKLKHAYKKYEKLTKQRKKILQKRKYIINSYLENNENLLKDNSINVRKYCKLEEKAHYKKEKALFKLGFLCEKPIHPIFNSIHTFISPYQKFLQKKFQNSKLNQQIQSVNTFKSQVIPQKLDNFFINKTKKCIKGYRKFKYVRKNFSNIISHNPVSKKISHIKAEALRQFENERTAFIPKVTINEAIAISSIQNKRKHSQKYEIAL